MIHKKPRNDSYPSLRNDYCEMVYNYAHQTLEICEPCTLQGIDIEHLAKGYCYAAPECSVEIYLETYEVIRRLHEVSKIASLMP